jgi:tRNA-uridine 2-sulfurtransferase
MFMKNWHDESVTISNECPWMEDSTDAMLVAEKLGIPFQAIDLSEEYKDGLWIICLRNMKQAGLPIPTSFATGKSNSIFF